MVEILLTIARSGSWSQISTFFASETSNNTQKFTKICQQVFELSAKLVKSPYPAMVKILCKNS